MLCNATGPFKKEKPECDEQIANLIAGNLLLWLVLYSLSSGKRQELNETSSCCRPAFAGSWLLMCVPSERWCCSLRAPGPAPESEKQTWLVMAWGTWVGSKATCVLWQTLQQAQIQRAAHLGWLLQGGEPGLMAVTPAASTGSSPAPGQCGAAPLSQSSRVGTDELGCLWGLSSRACFASFLGPGVGP